MLKNTKSSEYERIQKTLKNCKKKARIQTYRNTRVQKHYSKIIKHTLRIIQNTKKIPKYKRITQKYYKIQKTTKY